jgi:hypothetical protein
MEKTFSDNVVGRSSSASRQSEPRGRHSANEIGSRQRNASAFGPVKGLRAMRRLRPVFRRRFSEPLASDALWCFSLASFVSDRRDARPSTSPIQLSPVRLPMGTATSTSAVSCAATMPQNANKVSRSRELEWKKECFYRGDWRHRNYLPESAIFRHSKLRL